MEEISGTYSTASITLGACPAALILAAISGLHLVPACLLTRVMITVEAVVEETGGMQIEAGGEMPMELPVDMAVEATTKVHLGALGATAEGGMEQPLVRISFQEVWDRDQVLVLVALTMAHHEGTPTHSKEVTPEDFHSLMVVWPAYQHSEAHQGKPGMLGQAQAVGVTSDKVLVFQLLVVVGGIRLRDIQELLRVCHLRISPSPTVAVVQLPIPCPHNLCNLVPETPA